MKISLDKLKPGLTRHGAQAVAGTLLQPVGTKLYRRLTKHRGVCPPANPSARLKHGHLYAARCQRGGCPQPGKARSHHRHPAMARRQHQAGRAHAFLAGTMRHARLFGVGVFASQPQPRRHRLAQQRAHLRACPRSQATPRAQRVRVIPPVRHGKVCEQGLRS
jgi:hypothetical protein